MDVDVKEFGGGYLTRALYRHDDILVDAIRLIPPTVEYDTMVGIGLSGSLVIPMLARKLNKYFLLLRKESESSHSQGIIGEGKLGRKFMFVDDLISSGKTREEVKRKIYREEPHAHYVGSFLYGSNIDTACFHDADGLRTT